MRKFAWLVAAIGVSVLSTYGWACYVTTYCTCAVVGSCYSQKIIPTCQLPTCLIADSNASVWSVCQGNGSYAGRDHVSIDDKCCPSSCRIYDLCNQQYVSFNGAVCCFDVMHYIGTGSCR